MMSTPNPTARFRPRADVALLSQLTQAAREEHVRTLNAEIEAADVAGVITAWLESRYPAADMAVLERYGFARPETSIRVNADRHYFGVPLLRPVTLPDRGRSFPACATRFSEEPGYGLNPDYLAELTAAGGLEKYLADHREREAGFLPREVDPFFAKLCAARDEFERMARNLDDFATTKGAEGYPTWGEIESRFPVLGAYLARQRETAP